MQAVGAKKPDNNLVSQVGSRKRKAGISPPTTVELRGVNIHFPFRPYKCQEAYMGKVLDALLQKQNALLESPTGTGKTLCLLCATLAWQREQAKQLGDGVSMSQQLPKQELSNSLGNDTAIKLNPINSTSNNAKRVSTIVYASRTHSQLSQVVRELRNTRYRPKHAVLGSREQMCVHPKVKKEGATNSDINHDCNALAKERKCRYRNALEGFTAQARSGQYNDNNTQAVLDMEDLVQMGRQHKVCPFYYTRSLVADAELVLMPYNYLFDKDARDTTLQDICWNDAVVIFDEAHNLESFATDSASFDLAQTDIAICISELNRALNYMSMTGGDDGFAIKKENLTRLKALFLHFEEYLSNMTQAGAYQGEFMMEVFTKGMSINFSNHTLFIDEVKKVNELLLDARGGSGGKGAPKLEHFVQCVKRVFGESTEARCYAKAKSYRVHVSPKAGAQQQQQHQGGRNNNNQHNVNNTKANSVRTVSYWCFAPSLAMQELANLKIRSILVTSGTLSPLPSYSMELGLPFPHSLENPHIISDDQIHVRIIGKGVSGKELTSSYQRRQDADYYIELGNTLVSLAKVIPAGMLVFFPSYSVMEVALERWGGPASRNRNQNRGNTKTSSFFAARNRKGRNASNRQQYSFPFSAPSLYGSALGGGSNHSTPWKRLLGAKSVVIEPRSTADLPDAIAEFQKYLDMPKSKGCILCAVTRGKCSEGIDFANNMSRAVVITGLPFPPAFDPKVKLKREYLDGVKASKSIKSKEAGGFGGSGAPDEADDRKAPPSDKNDPPTALSGQEWYSQQAHRAVNQAIGRVIRNKDDYGAVLLLDSRYAQPGNQEGLSKWLRGHVLRDEGAGKAIASLARFFRQAEAKAKERDQAKGLLLQFEDEDTQEQKKRKQQERIDQAFTKVAFVKNMNNNLEQKATCSTELADKAEKEPVSYIAPDRIVARMNVDEMIPKKEALLAGRNDKQVGSTINHRTASVFDTASGSLMRTNGNSNLGSTGNTLQSRSQPTKSVDSKEAATKFFKKAQRLLTKEEFSTVRKAAVAMKQHGDEKDRKAYFDAARKVLSLCIQRERFFGENEKEHSETMLFLFFRLLPGANRRLVEQIAMRSLFKKSTLGKLFKESFPEQEHKKIFSDFSKFLQLIWCKDDESRKSPTEAKTEFLREAQAMLTAMQKCDKTALTSMFSAFKKLIPSCFLSTTEALISEVEASRSVQKMKESEERRKVEATIDAIRFQKPGATVVASHGSQVAKMEPAQQAMDKRQRSQTSSQSGEKAPTMRQASPNDNGGVPAGIKSASSSAKMKAHHPTSEASIHRQHSKEVPTASRKSAPTNPYAKRNKSLTSSKAKSLSSYIGQSSKENNGAQSNGFTKLNIVGNAPATSSREAPPYARKSALASVGRPLPQMEKSDKSKGLAKLDPVANMLHEAESQPFKHCTKGDIIRNLQSKQVPNITCLICDEPAKEPSVSECSHVACRRCWLQWLQPDRHSCPVCRKSVTVASLAYLVSLEGQSQNIVGKNSMCD